MNNHQEPHPGQSSDGTGLKNKIKSETATAGRFAIVGVGATMTHATVAAGLFQIGILSAFQANIAGFLAAFVVSFTGHYTWSFGHMRQGGGIGRSMRRFFVIAVSGFALNAFVLTLWLNLTPWPDLVGLLFSIAIVPALSFMGARLWAFSHSET